MTCEWAEAQMDLGRPCSIANIVRFTMTCVWAAAQMDLGRPWRPAAASMIRFQLALGVILASWFPIQVELMDTPGRDKCAANHRTTPRIPTWGTRPPDSDRLITNLEFFPLPCPSTSLSGPMPSPARDQAARRPYPQAKQNAASPC